MMAITSGASCLLATCLFVILFAAMQVYRLQLSSSQPMTILGGYLGSLLFMLSLTAIGNFESVMLGRGAQAKLIPEVLISILLACCASALVHRVCITTCFLFSLITLYYMNKISAKTYASAAPPVTAVPEKKKRR